MDWEVIISVAVATTILVLLLLYLFLYFVVFVILEQNNPIKQNCTRKFGLRIPKQLRLLLTIYKSCHSIFTITKNRIYTRRSKRYCSSNYVY